MGAGVAMGDNMALVAVVREQAQQYNLWPSLLQRKEPPDIIRVPIHGAPRPYLVRISPPLSPVWHPDAMPRSVDYEEEVIHPELKIEESVRHITLRYWVGHGPKS